MNNFNALRFWAAMAVLWSHSFPLSYGDNAAEPLWKASGGQTSIGTLAVAIFFVMSGYLITQSFKRSSSAIRFVLARILRLLPALIVVVCLLAFVIGPSVSILTLQEYFLSRSVYGFVLSDISLLKNYTGLPGVFNMNPMPYVVNGSLWTLHIEAGCYISIFFLGVLGILNQYVILISFLSVVLLELLFPHDQRLSLFAFFLGGSSFYFWRPPLHLSLALVAAGLIATSLWCGVYERTASLLLPYLIIFLSLSPTVRMVDMARFGDVSYGIYIYAFPVQQIVAMLSHQPAWWSNGLISTPVVLGLASLSWRLVERPALMLKDHPMPLMSRQYKAAWRKKLRFGRNASV